MAKNNLEDKFTFWCPIEKAQDLIDPTTGETVMRLGGIASTSDEDSDGEFLDPKGFDIKPLIESGMVNWHHQAKGQPATIIGEPTKAEIRPEGLYIETDLYPSSKIACDVWELAETLEKDSKTRRLGYSIEGKVVKRKSNDKNHPDYKKIVKAIITGVAITHQPKNPKTFANIIKGEIDDDFEDEVEEALDTETGKALKKESVDKKIKNQTFSKSEVIDRLFKDIPGISIEKAKSIQLMLIKFANMKGRNQVTDEDISKAYEALGLDFEANDIQKGGGCDTNGGRTTKESIKKAKMKKAKKAEDDDYEDEEEVDEREAKTKERLGGIKGDEKLHREAMKKAEEGEDDDETEDDEADYEEDEKTQKVVKKGGNGNRFDRIEKAIATSHSVNSKYIKALGVMVKDVAQKASAILNENIELKDIVKAQEDTIAVMSEKLEAFGSEVPAPKSLSAARPVERQFAKAEDTDITKGGQRGGAKGNQVSMSKNPHTVAELLDQATFAKGFDDEFSKACTAFEANKNLPANIIARMKNEYGVVIVK